MTIDIDKIEALAKGGSSGMLMKCSDVIALISEVRRLRTLLDNRPALNAGLIEAYHTWTAGVYASDAAEISGETKQ